MHGHTPVDDKDIVSTGPDKGQSGTKHHDPVRQHIQAANGLLS
jgi:hypothetical protein